jgi:hypothetical protein
MKITVSSLVYEFQIPFIAPLRPYCNRRESSRRNISPGAVSTSGRARRALPHLSFAPPCVIWRSCSASFNQEKLLPYL